MRYEDQFEREDVHGEWDDLPASEKRAVLFEVAIALAVLFVLSFLPDIL